MLKRVKDKLYYYFAEKNWGVRREYGPYVDAHQEEHAKRRWKHWWMLIRLNWHYRIFRRTNLLYYFDTETPVTGISALTGPESCVFKRKAPHIVAMELLKYDVISFDVFDTLILRPFLGPAEVFDLVGYRLNYMGFFNSFKKIRSECEKMARQKAFDNTGSYEVNIYEIYDEIACLTDIEPSVGIKTELETEKRVCLANPYMKRIFEILKAQGKTIIITSDMYLPEPMMNDLLQKCGYTGYDKVFVSCDYRCSKGNGRLYEILKDYASGRSLIHIGDNQRSDIKRAEEYGVKNLYYKKVREVGEKYRPKDMSSLISSAYAGIINNHLHNGIRQYSIFYELGFVYGGIYILGFCQWLRKRVEEKQIDKLLFMSRDGYIFFKIFKKMYPQIKAKYVFWSRAANYKYHVSQRNIDEFINRVFFGKIDAASGKYTIGALLQSLNLEELSVDLLKFGLTKNTVIANETKHSIKCFLQHNWETIAEKLRPEAQYAKLVFKEHIGNCKQVGIIDGPTTGCGPLGLKYLIEKVWKMDVTCSFFVTERSGRLLHDPFIEPYLFSQEQNKQNFNAHYKKDYNNSLFELLTQVCHPSFTGYGTIFSFDPPEIEDYQKKKEILKGIEDFCDIYYQTFRDDPIAMEISGHDAYMPYRLMIENPTFMRSNFGNLFLERTSFVDPNSQRAETLSEIMDQIDRKRKR